jgi:hypothetical protein
MQDMGFIGNKYKDNAGGGISEAHVWSIGDVAYR